MDFCNISLSIFVLGIFVCGSAFLVPEGKKTGGLFGISENAGLVTMMSLLAIHLMVSGFLSIIFTCLADLGVIGILISCVLGPLFMWLFNFITTKMRESNNKVTYD